ncbi:hypothetical protein FLAG1_10223 [Fusarium langsethiae]|uniref:VWFA domain-containing protein n=1 Tax=Fusarium langsethiae TaxID=179993 RepID=A0A0M9EPL0_FUSLA|nr:hypothetical protein FLAG1_10223 [Fusarium langsethiae]GKU07320.1 unnamed protein product [Fusarium langsethiae]GKU22574.1 unnamed protein product [Fusarium langsethiae]
MKSQAILCQPDDAGMAAMMVSVRPNDLFRNAIVPQAFSGEILFLLDRSGSMHERIGEFNGPRKINVLREAMLLVISGLPKTCSFNIVSWGSETWALWEQSRKHSPDNIKEAKEYISQIDANFEGTDLLRAFKSTVQRRRGDTDSTQIVFLTDGELDPYEPMKFVWKTRQELQNKIRFFALGIGDNVPHSLIESIAKLGGGFGDIVDTTRNPRWHNRLNRLFKSSLEPDSWDCDIDIGHEFERHSLMGFRLNRDTSDSHGVPYFQAPHAISALHPFKFTTIFFLIEVKDRGVLPSEVIITTSTHGAKKKKYKLPVKHTTCRDRTMHRLAVKATLMDLEGLVKRKSSNSPLVEENAETIGIRYSITSKWTSFVAVPEDQPTTTTEGSVLEHYRAIYDGVGFDELLMTADSDNSENGSLCEDLYDCVSITDPLLEIGQNLKSVDYGSWPESPTQRVWGIDHGEFDGYLPESQNKEDSVTSPSPRSFDPLNWELAVEYQNVEGLFKLPESAKGLLHLHFCPNTSLAVGEKLEELLHIQVKDQGVSKAVLVDTIMTIMCYQTHLVLEEDIWDLMMERARDAVAEAIGQDNLEHLEDILTASMMHKHYRAATGTNGNEGGGCTGRTTCPACDI